ASRARCGCPAGWPWSGSSTSVATCGPSTRATTCSSVAARATSASGSWTEPGPSPTSPRRSDPGSPPARLRPDGASDIVPGVGEQPAARDTGVRGDRRWGTIPNLARSAAERFGADEAIVDGDVRLTFADLWADARRAGRAFVAAGVEPGDRVAIWAPNVHEWVVALLGLQAAG